MRVLVPKSLLYFTFIFESMVKLLQFQASLRTIRDNVTQTVEIYLNFNDGSIHLSLKLIILTEYIYIYSMVCCHLHVYVSSKVYEDFLFQC